MPAIPPPPPDWQGPLALRVLEALSGNAAGTGPVQEILRAIVEETGIQCAAIRLRCGTDFPFQVSEGFSQEFIRQEASLDQIDSHSLPLTDAGGRRVLPCLCGAVLAGQADALPGCFTPGGSFRAGRLGEELRPCDLARIPGYRGRCAAAGYETQVLIPLREGAETIGLLNLCDRRAEVLSHADVLFLERLGTSVGLALAQRRAESGEADRRQVQERLRESEERWRAVVLNEPECVKLLDREGRVVDMNPAGLAMIQARLDQVQGRHANGLVAPEHRAAFDQMVADVFRGERRHLVFDMIGLRGRRLTLETTSVPLWDSPERQRVHTLLGVTRDVTERRRTEQALECLATSFAHLSGREFFEAVSRHIAAALGVDCVFVGRLQAAGDAVRVLGGWARGEPMAESTYELAGTPCDNVVGKQACTYPSGVQALFPEDEYLAREGIESYVGAPVLDKRQRAIGILVSLHSRPLSDPQAATRLFAMFLDRVSGEMQRLEAQEALERSEERLRLFFERQIVGMAITSPGQGWIQVNPRFCQMLGYSSEELARSSWSDLVHPGDLERELGQFQRLLSGEIDDYSTEQRFLRRDGGVIHAHLSVACVRRSGGSVDYVLRLLEDVTERKRAQESVKRSERMAAVGSLVAGVAHEVRNPLFAIQANLDALGAVLGPAADVDDLLGAMRTEVDRLRQLMDELLEYGKPSQPRLSEEGLQSCLQLALQGCRGPARAAGVELCCVEPPATVQLRLDRSRLAQVFENVILNAIQHSPRGGRVGLRFEPFAGASGWIRCVVEDQGPGIRPEDSRRIFDPFFTRRRGGTGLGLAIAQRIVEEHGGRILMENRASGGARALIELPAREERAGCAEPPPRDP